MIEVRVKGVHLRCAAVCKRTTTSSAGLVSGGRVTAGAADTNLISFGRSSRYEEQAYLVPQLHVVQVHAEDWETRMFWVA